MNNLDIAILQVSSFDGMCSGAKHYYGTLCWNGERIDLERKLNKHTMKELVKENYYTGCTTTRFNSEDHLIRFARRSWRKIFPKAKVLLIGSAAYLDPQKCIDGQIKMKKIINDYYNKAEKIGWYEGNEKEMTRLSDEYMEKVLGFKKE